MADILNTQKLTTTRVKFLAVLIVLGLSFTVVAQNPKTPPEPPSPPCECDVEGMERVAVHTYTKPNPKDGTETVGERGEVDILFYNPPVVVDGETVCLQYIPNGNNKWNFYASGGHDADVYVDPDDEMMFVPFGVPNQYEFTVEPKGFSSSSCGVLTFAPSRPGESACDTYTITAISKEGHDQNCNENSDCSQDNCSVVDGAKESGPVTVKVWRCQRMISKRTGTFYFYLLQEGFGLRNLQFEIVSIYFDCNGEISTMFQQISTMHGSLTDYRLAAGHKFTVDGQKRTEENLSVQKCGPSMADPRQKFVCSQTHDVFSFVESELGILNEYSIAINVGAATGFRRRSMPLTSRKCCY